MARDGPPLTACSGICALTLVGASPHALARPPLHPGSARRGDRTRGFLAEQFSGILRQHARCGLKNAALTQRTLVTKTGLSTGLLPFDHIDVCRPIYTAQNSGMLCVEKAR